MAAIKRNARKRVTSRIYLRDGSSVHVTRKKNLSAKDARQDHTLRRVVNQAVSAKVMKGLPIAKYDLAKKLPYWEYPDGRVEYVKVENK